jgi:LysR family carnitine catabolism transcriptional activator
MTINVSYKLLNAFLMLVEHNNFTRAAERCHVSQSSFSAMIQRLEEEVGTRLFDRNTRNVVLTPEGELFSEAASLLVKEIEWTFSDLKDYVAKKKGRVSIAVLPSLAGEWLLPVLVEYRKRYPGIAVEVHDVLSDRCLDLLQQGKADIALAAPNVSLEEFSAEHFHTDRFFLVCRRDHALASSAGITLAELGGYDFIRLARTTSIHQHLDNAVGVSGVAASSFEVENLSTVSGLIVSGLGVSLLPELTLPQFRHPDLVAIPLLFPDLRRPIHIIRSKDKPLSVAAQALLDLVRLNKPLQQA